MAWQYYHRVWLIMGFGWISLYLVRMGISPTLGMIMKEFDISYATAGTLFSAIFYSYTMMQLPSGYLGDRFGRKKILILGAFLWFLLSLATSLVHTFAMLVVVRFLTGIAHGIYFGNDRPTIIAATPREKSGQGQGISFMGLSLGFFLSVFLAGVIADYTQNWRWVFVFFSIPSLVTSYLIFRYIREPNAPEVKDASARPSRVYRQAFVDRNLWLMYLSGFTMLYGFWLLATWMPSIYQDLGITNIAASSLLAAFLGLIGIPGLFVTGMLSDAIARRGYGRKWFMAACVFALALLMVLIGYALENKASGILMTTLFLASGFFVFGVWPPYYALLSEMAPSEAVGTTFGLANLIGFLSAWIAPYVTGWIKDTTGSFANGVYLAGFLMVAGAILLLAVKSPGPVDASSG